MELRSPSTSALFAAVSLLTVAAYADEPGSGLTAQFEIDFLEFSIDQ